MNRKPYYEKIVDEVLGMIKDNIHTYYNFNEDSFPNIKDYCKDKYHTRYKKLSYNQLLFFTEEILVDLINCPYLYDFRELE